MGLVVVNLFLLGLVIGSFLNVVIYRAVYGQSPFKGRSKCPRCKRTISWKHNIPLLSFFLLRGRCASCGKKISWRYPLVELLTGLLFVWWWVMGQGFFLLASQPFVWWQPVFWLGVGVMLLLVFVFDVWYGIIPDGLNLSLLLWVLVYRVSLVSRGMMMRPDFVAAVASGLGLTLFFYFLYRITAKKGFGLGDVKLAPSLGLILGWPQMLVGVTAAYILGAILGIVLLAAGRKKFGQTIPFGPFLVAGVVVALLWGDQLLAWYLNML